MRSDAVWPGGAPGGAAVRLDSSMSACPPRCPNWNRQQMCPQGAAAADHQPHELSHPAPLAVRLRLRLPGPRSLVARRGRPHYRPQHGTPPPCRCQSIPAAARAANHLRLAAASAAALLSPCPHAVQRMLIAACVAYMLQLRSMAAAGGAKGATLGDRLPRQPAMRPASHRIAAAALRD